MRKRRRTAVGFVVASTIDLDRSGLLWDDESPADYSGTGEQPFRMLLIAALAIVAILVFASPTSMPPHILSQFPNVPGIHGSRAITGNAVPNTAAAVPNGIAAEATQDLDTAKMVSGIQANEQFRVNSENAAERDLRLGAGGEPLVQLPDGAIVTVTGMVTLDNQWAYVRSRAGDEGWIQLKVLRRLTNDVP